jgi:hypothetical protein
MKNQATQYLALDVHQATIVATLRSADGPSRWISFWVNVTRRRDYGGLILATPFSRCLAPITIPRIADKP